MDPVLSQRSLDDTYAMDYERTHGKPRQGTMLFCADCARDSPDAGNLLPFTIIPSTEVDALCHFVGANSFTGDFSNVPVSCHLLLSGHPFQILAHLPGHSKCLECLEACVPCQLILDIRHDR